jgi:branched-chain amino acid aminotransferase
MTDALEISVTKTERSRLKDISLENLPFGKYFTDHMLEADFENGEWKSADIKPYQPLLMEPSLAALHYGRQFLKE